MVKHAPVTGIGRRPVIGRPWRLNRTPVSIRRASPLLGEANAYVLQDLVGLSSKTFDRLVVQRLTGELGAPPPAPRPIPLYEQVRLGRIHSHDPAYRERLGIEAELGVGKAAGDN